MRLEWPKSKENPKVILREKSMLRHNYIQIRVYKINKESVTHFSQRISVEVIKMLRKSQAQFREKLRKLRLRQNDGFLISKKRVLC